VSEPDDLEFEPIRTDPRKAIAILVALGLAGFAAYKLNARSENERKARELQNAADAWESLQRCLVGPHGRVGAMASVVRRIELGVPALVSKLPPDRRRREWPYRCATYASKMTRAIFESRTDERPHRLLNQFASQAATDLEQGALHTGKDDPRRYLDELFAVADRAGLPPGHAGDVPAPPAPSDVLRVQPLLAAFAGPGSVTLQAEESVATTASVDVIVGRGERRYCRFTDDLTRVACRPEQPTDRAQNLHLSAPDAPFPTLPAGALTPPWRAADALVALVPAAAATTGDAGVSAGDASVADGGDAGVQGPTTRVYAGLLRTPEAPWTWSAPLSERGTIGPVSTPPVVRACAYGTAQGADAPLALVVYAQDSRAAVLWRASPTSLTVTQAEARPGSIACGNGTVRLAWYASQPYPTLHVTTCTPTGCSHQEGNAPEIDPAPAVATLGDKVLIVYTRPEFQGLRYRLAPLAQMLDAREVAVFDDGDHEGMQLESAPVLVARGEVAVALVNRKTTPNDAHFVRIDARGHRELNVSGSP
jgi:hypothetical protein